MNIRIGMSMTIIVELKHIVLALALIFAGQSVMANAVPCSMNGTGVAHTATAMAGTHGQHAMDGVDASTDDAGMPCCGDSGHPMLGCPMLGCMSNAIFATPSLGLLSSHAGLQPELPEMLYFPPERTSLYRPPISR